MTVHQQANISYLLKELCFKAVKFNVTMDTWTQCVAMTLKFSNVQDKDLG